MKKIHKYSIENIKGTDIFDNIFSINYFQNTASDSVKIIYMKDLLEAYKNKEILKRVKEKPAMYSEVYSPKDELGIFSELFEEAISENKKIHIV